jgi:hypothetical protein
MPFVVVVVVVVVVMYTLSTSSERVTFDFTLSLVFGFRAPAYERTVSSPYRDRNSCVAVTCELWQDIR